MPYWLQAIIFFISTLILLRLSGKRTIAQMTPGEAVIMISLGTLLVHPLKTKDSWLSVYNGLLIVTGLIVTSLLQIYLPGVKRLVMGQPIMLIEDGEIQHHNLRLVRMTVDELKMKLRLKKVDQIKKVHRATLEVSGKLGIELYPEHTPATKGDVEEIKQALQVLAAQLNAQVNFKPTQFHPMNDLFIQVEKVQQAEGNEIH